MFGHAPGGRVIQQTLFEKSPELRKIARFRGRWDFLHNFYVEPDGSLVEREYQAEKCCRLADKKLFAGLNGRAAKDLGRAVEQRSDWKEVRVDVMRNLVLQKFRDHPSLQSRLLSTGEWWLEEGNNHGDIFWGVVDGFGENQLGLILMQVRDVLRMATE